jgi:hypothetical protein
MDYHFTQRPKYFQIILKFFRVDLFLFNSKVAAMSVDGKAQTCCISAGITVDEGSLVVHVDEVKLSLNCSIHFLNLNLFTFHKS